MFRTLNGTRTPQRRPIALATVLVAALGLMPPAAGASQDPDAELAQVLAAMLRAGRTVISANQDRINDPKLADKGLGGKTVLEQSLAIFREATKSDPLSLDPKSRAGRLIRMQMDSIVEVVDAHQQTINRPDIGFKGFIPAVFARLVNEAFNRRAAGLAEIKVTAPQVLIRNRKAQADEWESEVIRETLLSPQWPKGRSFTATVPHKGRPAYRTAVPEYYAASCLSCHGSPKGDIDLTGFPKEGAQEGDLGGVISITLYR